MEYSPLGSAESLLFVDTHRLAFYVENLNFEHPRAPFPMWDPEEGYGSKALPGAYEAQVAEDINKVIARLEATGYAAHGPMTASDRWLFDGHLTAEGGYRLEDASARRVRIPAENGGELGLWISVNQARKLFLWERRADLSEPPLFHRSRDDTAVQAFTQYSFRPLQEAAFDYLQLALDADGMRRDPIGALWKQGAQAGSEREVTLFYGLDQVVYPVRDEGDLVMTFGYPIAVWERTPQAAAPADDEIERVLVFLSVDDDQTQTLVGQIRASRLLRAYEFSFDYAIDRYGASANTDAARLAQRMGQAIERANAEAMIVHLGSVFNANQAAYRDALAEIRARYPEVLVISDQAVRAGAPELAGMRFDLTDELREIVEHIFL